MDRLLKPQVLSVDPGDPLAFKAYKHWMIAPCVVKLTGSLSYD